jgi:hypothetical protein
MLAAIVAATCMIVQDSLAVIKYQAASRNQGAIAAFADVIIWIVSITSTTIAAFTFHGHNLMAKIAVVAFVSAANIGGNLIGVKLGRKYVKDDDKIKIEKRLAELERKLEVR